MSEARILPHPRVHVEKWDIDGYPAEIKVMMSDKTSVIFERKIQQPAPQVIKCIDLIQTMKKCTYGGYKAKHEKK